MEYLEKIKQIFKENGQTYLDQSRVEREQREKRERMDKMKEENIPYLPEEVFAKYGDQIISQTEMALSEENSNELRTINIDMSDVKGTWIHERQMKVEQQCCVVKNMFASLKRVGSAGYWTTGKGPDWGMFGNDICTVWFYPTTKE